MHRITPVLFLVVGLTACGGSDEASTTSAPDTTEQPTTIDSSDTTTVETTEPADTAETTETSAAETTETTAAGEPTGEVGDLCSAYLASITPSTTDQGLADLVAILGTDAPSGIQDALDTLQEPNDDVEAFFTAKNSIDSYVLPICNQQFRRSIVPEADNAAAADAFFAALRDGDRNSAERLAPTNVIAQFDWSGYPEATSDFEADNSTFNLLLAPTVTVFCQLEGGAIEFCAFGE